MFDSSVDRGETSKFRVDGVIKGWTEALQLMTIGDKWKLFIPSDLAYGETGNNSIGPNETLIFEVELIGITPKEIPEPPLDLNLTDVNSSSAEAPLIIPEVDVNATLLVVEENATVPLTGTVRIILIFFYPRMKRVVHKMKVTIRMAFLFLCLHGLHGAEIRRFWEQERPVFR